MKPIIHKSFQKNLNTLKKKVHRYITDDLKISSDNFWQKLDLKNDVNDDVFSEKSIYLLKVLFYYEC